MLQTLNSKKEFHMIDYCRLICAIGILTLHLNPLLDINANADFFVGNILTRVCVPFFFITSGFFLQSKIHDWSKTKGYIKHILQLYVLYSILYLPQEAYRLSKTGNSVSQNLLLYFKRLFLVASYAPLWYFVSTIVAVLLLFFFANKLHLSDKWIIILTIVLYVIGVLGNAYLYNWLMSQEKNLWSLYVKIFETTRNGFFYGFPCIAIGYLLSKNGAFISKKRYLPLTMISFLLMAMEVYFIQNHFHVPEIDMTFFLLPTTICLFLLVAFCNINKPNAIRTAIHCRKLSVLIYGLQLFVWFYLSRLLKDIGWNTNSLSKYIIVLIITVVVSEGILYLAEKKHITILKKMY